MPKRARAHLRVPLAEDFCAKRRWRHGFRHVIKTSDQRFEQLLKALAASFAVCALVGVRPQHEALVRASDRARASQVVVFVCDDQAFREKDAGIQLGGPEAGRHVEE